MSGMRVNQRGAINLLLFPLIISVLLLIGAIAFGYWAYGERQDYKNHADDKIADAVVIAKQQESSRKDKEFVEKEKQPYRTYTSPAVFGSVTIQFPKTWSAYVKDEGNSNPYIDGYFYPNVVHDADKNKAVFALRVELTNQSYDSTLREYEGRVKEGSVRVSAFKAAKVPSVVGSRLDGEVEPDAQGVMVILPLRDRTLKLWTNSTQYAGDFETHILPNFSFSP